MQGCFPVEQGGLQSCWVPQISTHPGMPIMPRLSLLELHSGGEVTSNWCHIVLLGAFGATVT